MIEALIPLGKSGGGKRTVIMREVVNGLKYVLSTGCQWRAIPKDLPPKSTVYDYFDLWTYDGTLQRIHQALYEQCREQAQREASPTAAIIDSQSVKAPKRGACIDELGCDSGKKIKDKKRHVLVDTLGLLLHAVVHPPTFKIEITGLAYLREIERRVFEGESFVPRGGLRGSASRWSLRRGY